MEDRKVEQVLSGVSVGVGRVKGEREGGCPLHTCMKPVETVLRKGSGRRENDGVSLRYSESTDANVPQ
jgi:hypothetical protein